MANSGMGDVESTRLTGGLGPQGYVVSAIFPEVPSAEAAIRELREFGVLADQISVISRNEDHPETSAGAGVSIEDVGDEALAYRASPELPNQEDLPISIADQIGDPLPPPADAGVATGGGSDRDGLSSQDDMVRRNEAETNADQGIYTDFPDKPGGVNPDSPVAAEYEGTVQQPMKNRTPASGTAATGAALGGIGGLLVGLGVLAVPGIGPILAAGPLAGAIGGLLAGGAAGGVIGALSSAGVPEEYARDYAAKIQQGQTLVSVRTDLVSCDPVERILVANGGQNVSST